MPSVWFKAKGYGHTRAMISDSTGKLKMKVITEEHESVTEEPSGRYLAHFVPRAPVNREKPALKVAQGLLDILLDHMSTDSVQFLSGDSTNMNTGWKVAPMHYWRSC